MKTTYNNKRTAGVKATLFLFAAFLFTTIVNAQHSVGISVSSNISSIGFGSQYGTSLFWSNSKILLGCGPVFQKRNTKLTGAQVSAEYTFFDGSKHINDPYAFENMSLFLFANTRYHNDATLGNYALQMEEKIKTRTKTDFRSLHYKAVETYGGFGMRIQLNKKLQWCNAIGVGGYKTFSGAHTTVREYNSMSLLLRTSLVFRFM